MLISLIVAIDENNGIGYQNKLPWGYGLKADLKRFKELTTGHTVIMGRKTFESIGRPLPNRNNILLTRDTGFKAEGVEIADALEKAISLAQRGGETEAFIIGGANIFEQALPLANKIYLTRVHGQFPADTFFPKIESPPWQKTHKEFHPKDAENLYDTTFEINERK